MTLKEIFPIIDNIKDEGNYMLVDIQSIEELNNNDQARKEFLQYFKYFTQGDICNNYIFFVSISAAKEFINQQSGWWKSKTLYSLLYKIKNEKQLININNYKHIYLLKK